MFKKVFFAIALFVFFFSGLSALADTPSNLGIVKENIWYSKDPFVEGDKIKIYTVIFNPDSKQLSGNLVFFDNGVILGKKPFNLAANSANDISIDWTATAGTHKIYAKIEDAKFLISNGKYELVEISSSESYKSSRVVLKNTESTETPSLKVGLENTLQVAKQPISGFEEKIINNIPSFISKPANGLVNTIDEARLSLATETSKEVSVATKDLEDFNKESSLALNKPANSQTPVKVGSNSLVKPFKYLKLFFLNIALVVFQNKAIFYSLCALILFLIFRYIWNKIL